MPLEVLFLSSINGKRVINSFSRKDFVQRSFKLTCGQCLE